MMKDHKMEDTLHKVWSMNFDIADDSDEDILISAGYMTSSIYEFFQDLSIDCITQNNQFEDRNFINAFNDPNYFDDLERI